MSRVQRGRRRRRRRRHGAPARPTRPPALGTEALQCLSAYARSAKPARLAALVPPLPRAVVEVLGAVVDAVLMLVLAVYYVVEAAVFELLPRRYVTVKCENHLLVQSASHNSARLG